MRNKKQRIIPAHYSWNSSIFTRGVVDPIKRKLGWVNENKYPVSLKESASGQELDRIKDIVRNAGKLAATGLAFSNPTTAKSAIIPFIVESPLFHQEKVKNAIIGIKRNGGIVKRVESGKSGIHIKPENRGKFTALKKRTGKSSTWYKEHGTPAQKKMAVFALNARKWKHK